MKQYLCYCLIGLFFACSDKYQSLYDASGMPMVRFERDTMYIREKDPYNINETYNGRLVIYHGKASRQLNLRVSDTSGLISCRYRDQLLLPTQPLVVGNDSTLVFLSCNRPGIYAVDILLTDRMGKQVNKELIVACWQNKRPVADVSLLLKDSTLLGNWEYLIDASASFDPDGKIMQYYFVIDGLLVSHTEPYLNWIFHNSGLHVVQCFLKDDLDNYSDTLTKTIWIP